MLLLLLCLSTLGLVSDAAPVGVAGSGTIDLTSCPITYFGKRFTSLEVAINSQLKVRFHFSGFAEQILVPDSVFQSFNYELLDAAGIASVAATVESDIPDLVSTASCGLKITVTRSGPAKIHTYLLNYGDQAAVHFSGTVADGDSFSFVVGSNPVGDVSFRPTTSDSFERSIDVTGCRLGGRMYRPTEMAPDPSACTTETCQSTGVFDSVSVCPPSAVCLGANMCGEQKFCSMVGWSVVDFNKVAGTVSNYCTYVLVDSGSGFRADAYFGERKLVDVSFVKYINVTTASGEIILKQGNTLLVNGEDVSSSLSSTASAYVGAFLTRDDTGAVLSYTDTNNLRTSIFFDGTLLHMTHNVPLGQSAYSSGLCADINANSKDAALSESGCETVPSDSAGDNIDCASVQTRCQQLMNLPSSSLDPAPFVRACADNLLCHYPDVDGIACRFLDAFARTSGLSIPREESGCAVPVCVNHHCADHEYCTENNNGEAICKCRPLNTTLNAYRENEEYGDVATCSGSSASLSLYACLLEEDNVDAAALHLIDSSCTGSFDDVNRVVTFSFGSTNECGAESELQTEGTAIALSNQVRNSAGSIITHQSAFTLGFSCVYSPATHPRTVSLSVQSSSTSVTYDAEEEFYDLLMSLYDSDDFSTALSETAEVDLNEMVFVRVEARDIWGQTLALVIEDCWTTSDSSPTGANRYSLITDECAVAESVSVISSGVSLDAKFQFKTFVYVSNPTADVYLHCQVRLCIMGDPNTCVPTCT